MCKNTSKTEKIPIIVIGNDNKPKYLIKKSQVRLSNLIMKRTKIMDENFNFSNGSSVLTLTLLKPLDVWISYFSMTFLVMGQKIVGQNCLLYEYSLYQQIAEPGYERWMLVQDIST